MNYNELYTITDTKDFTLASAYAILMDNGESILLRGFDDAKKLAYRLKIAEEVIKDTENSKMKEEIVERIEWYKECIITNVIAKQKEFSSYMAASRAPDGQIQQYYNRFIQAIRSKDLCDDFYDWISTIDKII